MVSLPIKQPLWEAYVYIGTFKYNENSAAKNTKVFTKHKSKSIYREFRIKFPKSPYVISFEREKFPYKPFHGYLVF